MPSFQDDFERADGPLGPDWILGQGQYYYPGVHPFTIVDGAAEGTVPAGGTGDDDVNQTVRAEEYGPDQFIEAEVENVWPNGSIQLIAHANDDDKSCHIGFFFFNSGGDDVVSVWLLEQSDTDEVGQSFINVPHAFTHPVTCRLEADADNTLRAYVDGELALTWEAPGTIPTGPRVGIACEFGTTDPGSGIIEGSPRFLSVSGGTTAWCDHFDRADGDPGADWVHVAQADDWNDISTTVTIDGGVLVTAPDTGTGAVHDWATYHAAAEMPTTGPRFIEFDIERWGTGFQIYLYTQMNDADWSRQYFYIQSNPTPYTFMTWASGHLSADGTDETDASGGTVPNPVGSSMTIRFESEDDGTCRFFRDGELVEEFVDSEPVTGEPYVGFSMSVNYWHEGPIPGIGSFCIGGGEAEDIGFCDNFEGADGPLSDDWVAGTSPFQGWTHNDQVISGGAAIEPIGDPPVGYVGNMLTAVGTDGDHSIEVIATNVFQELSEYRQRRAGGRIGLVPPVPSQHRRPVVHLRLLLPLRRAIHRP